MSNFNYLPHKLLLMVTLFISCLLISNVIASKLVMVFGLVVPAAVFVFPLTFLLTDVISEVWGKRVAQYIIWLGFAASLLLVGYLTFAQWLPYAPFWEHQASFEIILGAVPRIVLASMTAYIISQTHDVWAFHWWRTKTNGKHLWVRNNFSTITSQLLDSIIFITIAFWGIVPNSVLLTMILSQYVVKVAIAIIDTPFCYLTVKFLRGV